MNKKKYWLRGLIVGFVGGLIIYFVYVPYMINKSYQDCLSIPGDYHGMCGVGSNYVGIAGIVYSILLISILTLIGWIYGRIKNQKSFIATIFITIVVLLAIGGGIYAGYVYISTPHTFVSLP